MARTMSHKNGEDNESQEWRGQCQVGFSSEYVIMSLEKFHLWCHTNSKIAHMIKITIERSALLKKNTH